MPVLVPLDMEASRGAEGTWGAEELFTAGRTRDDCAEGQYPRSRLLISDSFVARASRFQQGRQQSRQVFQSNIVSDVSFDTALGGFEMEDPLPNTTQIEPDGRLRWNPWPFLLRLKVNTFSVPLGVSSQAQLWGTLSNSPLVMSAMGGMISTFANRVRWGFWITAMVLLGVIAVGYFFKMVLYWGAVKREWAHPIRSNFAFTPFLAAMTLVGSVPRSIARELHPKSEVYLPVFMVLSVIVLYLEIASYGKWLFNETGGLSRANPSYQLAVVGNFIIAGLGTRVSGGPNIEMACEQISLLFFAVGMLYLMLVFFAIQQNSAHNVGQPTGNTSAPAAVAPSPEITNGSNAGGKGRGGVKSIAGDSRRQQEAHRGDPRGQNRKLSSGAAVAGRKDNGIITWGHDAKMVERMPSPVEEDCLSCGIVPQISPSKDGGISLKSGSSRTDAVPSPLMEEQDCLSCGLVPGDTAAAVGGPKRAAGGAGATSIGNSPSTRATSITGGARSPEYSTPTAVATTQEQAPVTAMPRRRMVLGRDLHPIYFLFIAPPAVASVAWNGIQGEFDTLAKSLYFIAGFLYVFLVVGNSRFLRTTSFSIAWWAYTFPSGAFATATIFYAEDLQSEGVVLAAIALGLVSTIVVLVVFVLTLSYWWRGNLFAPDPVLSIQLLGGATDEDLVEDEM